MSVDLLGPACDQAVTVRPGRTITRGVTDTWIKDCTSADANDGTVFVADFFNDILAQLRVALRSSGITLDGADDMLWRAMQSLGLRYGVDSGAANHLTVAFSPAVASLFDGLALLIKVGVDGTGAADITANATATTSLVWPDGTAIASGDLKAGAVILVVYVGGKYQLLCRMNGGGAAAANFVPGCVYQWPTDTAPTGTLECNGTAVSRTTYARLFGIIGTNYGVGNGTTTFNLPNYSGKFLRGVDHGAGVDIDAASRTNRGDGTTGDHVGTKEAAAVKGADVSGAVAITALEFADVGGNGQLQAAGGSSPAAGDGSGSSVQWIVGDTIGFGPRISSLSGSMAFTGGGSETRPQNVNILYVIAI